MCAELSLGKDHEWAKLMLLNEFWFMMRWWDSSPWTSWKLFKKPIANHWNTSQMGIFLISSKSSRKVCLNLNIAYWYPTYYPTGCTELFGKFRVASGSVMESASWWGYPEVGGHHYCNKLDWQLALVISNIVFHSDSFHLSLLIRIHYK